MRRFKDYFNESQSYSSEIESKILALNPSKYNDNGEKKLWTMHMPNMKAYSQQENIHGSYTRGSLYDAFWNFHASADVIAHIEKSHPRDEIEEFIQTFSFDFEGKTHNLKIVVPFPKLYKKYNATKKWNDRPEFPDIISATSFDLDGKAFSYNTFRSRAGVTPPLELKGQIKKIIQDAGSVITSGIRKHEAIVDNISVLMLDDVIDDYLDQNIKNDVDKMKKILSTATTGEELKRHLRDFGFEGIPEDKEVLDGMIKSKDYSYSTSRPDGYGHTTGTEWSVNFAKKKVIMSGWSSDD